MEKMFEVRSARALAPQALSRGPSPCMPVALLPPNALTPPGPHLAAHRMPAFCLRRGRPLPPNREVAQCPPSRVLSSGPPTFNRALPLHAARVPCPHVSRPAPRLLAARGGVQPADPQLQYVQGHNHERYVASALLLRATSCPAALPALHRLPSFRLSTLGRPRLCSTSRSPSIRPALRT